MSDLSVPVAFLIFNRPELTARVWASIARARPPRLFVVGDGPRDGHPDDKDLVAQARAVIEQVDWPCEVLTCYSDINLGCGRRIATGLDWVFSHTDAAIILEDDCLPDITFFRYCEELLDRYRHDKRVHMISGTNVTGLSGPHSYHFSRCYHIWGWATWSRAWRHYDYEMRRWPELRETDWLAKHVTNERAMSVAQLYFDETYAGRIDQWDFQWAFCGWLQDAFSVIPSSNLVRNIGYGAAATHELDDRHPFADLPTQAMSFPLRHPPGVEVMESADMETWARLLPVFPDLANRDRPWQRVAAAVRRGGRYRRGGATAGGDSASVG